MGASKEIMREEPLRKVLHLVHQNYYRDGRVKRYVGTLARAGVDVDVLGLRDKDQSEIDPDTGANVYSIPLTRSYGDKRSYIKEYGLAIIYYFIWVTLLYIRNRYQVIHVHNMPDILVVCAIFPRVLGARIVLDIHDPTPEFYMSKYESGEGLMVRIMRFQERLSTGIAHEVIAANSNFRDRLIIRGVSKEKITTIVNFPDLQIFDRSALEREDDLQNEESFSLVYPGTIAPRYGLEVAIRSIPLVLHEIPHIRLLIVGKITDHARELQTIVKELGLAPQVTFYGAVPSDQVPMLLMQSQVGIYPALSDPHMDIAIPSKVLEFAAMRLPIIASRLAVIEQLFPGGSVLLVSPGSAEEFADAIIQLFHSKDLRMKMIDAAEQSLFEKGNWDKEGDKYLGLVSRKMTKG